MSMDNLLLEYLLMLIVNIEWDRLDCLFIWVDFVCRIDEFDSSKFIILSRVLYFIFFVLIIIICEK